MVAFPSTRITRPVGSIKRLMSFSVVVLPQPDSPEERELALDDH
jgi:hypothetical protein